MINQCIVKQLKFYIIYKVFYIGNDFCIIMLFFFFCVERFRRESEIWGFFSEIIRVYIIYVYKMDGMEL